MCGIVGYVGKKNAKEVILSGLRRLEYRGYDSAGISLFNNDLHKFEIYKSVGKVNDLETTVSKFLGSFVGIGHTRWATHGKVSVDNAHPHYSKTGRFIIVHNGVIENYSSLKKQYLVNSHFYSQTDTEVIAQLIESFANSLDVENAILTTLKLLEGSYALLVIDTTTPEIMYGAKYKSPLVVGKGAEGITIASDLMALIGYSDEYLPLEDKTFVVVKDNKVELYNLDHQRLDVKYERVLMDSSDVEKGHYDHFMLKEIYEQPAVIRQIISKYYDSDEQIHISEEIRTALKDSDLIYILGAGTSMHAGYVGKHIFENLTNKPVEVHIASEFAYNMPLISKKPLFILISQSGETADLRACLVKIKNLRYPSLTLTNVITSTLAREADYALELHAGPEIAVASTKAYVASIAVLAIISASISSKKVNYKLELAKVANAIENFLANQKVALLIKDFLTKRNCFFIGRGVDYYVTLEAALKLKEISYIQAEGFAAGELKHGTIALIEDDTPVIALISNANVNLNTRNNINEVSARGAKTLIIVSNSLSHDGDDIILDDVDHLLSPMLLVVPTQLIAYYAALNLGNDIDKPRNLAKSVTVE